MAKYSDMYMDKFLLSDLYLFCFGMSTLYHKNSEICWILARGTSLNINGNTIRMTASGKSPLVFFCFANEACDKFWFSMKFFKKRTFPTFRWKLTSWYAHDFWCTIIMWHKEQHGEARWKKCGVGHTCMHDVHICTCTRTHARTLAHTHACVHSRAHARAHTHKTW